MIAIILLVFFSMIAPTAGMAEQLSLPRNIEGWTIFTPSADSHIVYVSSSGDDSACTSYLPENPLIGSDPFNPVGAIVPCASYAAAFAKTTSGKPDWILVKRGDTFTERIYGNHRSGRSATEPFLIGAYGATGNMPVFKTPVAYDTQFFVNGSRQWLVMTGIEFYASTRDPASPDYVKPDNIIGINFYAGAGSTVQGILFEGCKFRFFKEHILANAGAALFSGVTWRRNIFLDNYSGSTAHSQGLYAAGINDLVVEENVFDHNGWMIQNNGDATPDTGEATSYSHSMYLSYCPNFIARNNIISRSSSMGVKLDSDNLPATQNHTVDNNLFVDGNIGVGANDGDTDHDYRLFNVSITDNVFSRLGASNTTNGELAWALYTRDLDVARISNNLMLNQDNAGVTNVRFFEMWGGSRGVVFEGNIAYGNKNMTGLYLRAGGEKDVVIRNNDIQTPAISGVTVAAGDESPNNIDSALSGYVLSGNRYYTNRDENDRFTLNGTKINDVVWFSNTGDNSTFTQASYPDSTKDVTTYMATLGEDATVDAFIAKCRAQDRYNWDSRIGADTVNDYIRAGFGMGEYTPPGQARRLSLAGRPIKLVEPGP